LAVQYDVGEIPFAKKAFITEKFHRRFFFRHTRCFGWRTQVCYQIAECRPPNSRHSALL
jgi:hypothetical protein